MATAKIEEYANVGLTAGPAIVQAPLGPPDRVQVITFDTTSAISLALLPETSLIIVSTTAASGYWKIGYADDIVATEVDMDIFGGTYRGMAVRPGSALKYVAFIEASA